MASIFSLKTVSSKALALVVVLIVLSVAATTLFLLQHFNKILGVDRLRQNLTAAEMILNPAHEGYSVENGKLLVGGRPLNGDFKGVDSIASAFGGVATVFLSDTRIATNVKKPDGTRAVGTKLAAGPVYDAVLGQGKEYLGSAKILGADYVTAYEPIKDSAGQTIGVLFVGFLKSEFNKQMTNAVMVAVMAGLVLAAGCAAIGWFIFARLFAPFRPLAKLMEDARHGHYSDNVPYTDRADEFGELARVIEMFNKAVKERQAQRTANIELVNTTFGEALAALASRDLRYRLDREIPVEYRALQENFNNAVLELDGAMQDIDGRARDIASGSAEIHKASQQMAHRTEREAAALEETSAAMNQLSTSVEKSAQGAKDANDAAALAKRDAQAGSHTAKNAVEAIRAIAQSSNEITNIISVINEIAFQTNLLALNAGVEAARAGDAGRGFAVVASEVRSLAQRSSEAAKQIKQLITHSEEQVDRGVKLVEESGAAFGKIVDQVVTIYDLVSAISASQNEQATALKEIDTAIGQLDQTTQQNAAMAEESCAASDAMADHAGELETRVGQFNIHRDERSVRPTPTPARNPRAA
ncbi:MAG: methyl-accepting chemotaxis protein [Rhizomicrobium sp.]|nr:methyl-accepting chemotaxis protein [Rhizomicrobium sp.]